MSDFFVHEFKEKEGLWVSVRRKSFNFTVHEIMLFSPLVENLIQEANKSKKKSI